MGDLLGFSDKHYNGSLGLVAFAAYQFNKIPKGVQRNYAYKLSKLINVKSGAIYQNTYKFVRNVGKFASKYHLGAMGNALTLGNIAYDIIEDGEIKVSSVVSGGLMAVGLLFPATAPFILAYGVADYFLGISDFVDSKTEQIPVRLP